MTSDRLQVPGSALRSLSPSWFTRAVRARYPGAVVSRVEVLNVSRGTTTRVRVKLSYSQGQGPGQVFVKAQGRLGHRLMLLAIGMLYAEARFYAQVQDLPVPVPSLVAAATNRSTLSSVVVLEDITTTGARPNIATSPLAVHTVADGVDALARLHGRYWRGSDAGRAMSWLPTARMTPGWAFSMFAGTRRGIPKALNLGMALPTVARSARRLTALYARSIADTRGGETTVLHGDTHIGNTYVGPDGRLGFLDWQLVRRGAWQHDLTYFVTSALTIADRVEHERALLGRYLNGLAAAGVAAPDWEQAWRSYRRALPYGLTIWLATLGWSDYQSDAVSLATAERFASAFADHRPDRL
jgi:hypothetical protein